MAPQPSSAAFTMHRPNGYAGNPEARNNKPPPEDLDDDLKEDSHPIGVRILRLL